MKILIENNKSIPTAYDNENSTGHLNMIYIKLLSGKIKQCKEINLLFPKTSQFLFPLSPIFGNIL